MSFTPKSKKKSSLPLHLPALSVSSSSSPDIIAQGLASKKMDSKHHKTDFLRLFHKTPKKEAKNLSESFHYKKIEDNDCSSSDAKPTLESTPKTRLRLSNSASASNLVQLVHKSSPPSSLSSDSSHPHSVPGPRFTGPRSVHGGPGEVMANSSGPLPPTMEVKESARRPLTHSASIGVLPGHEVNTSLYAKGKVGADPDISPPVTVAQRSGTLPAKSSQGAGAHWPEGVDVIATSEILESLNEHINQTSARLLREQDKRSGQLGEFLINMNTRDGKTNMDLKRQFEEANRNSNKTLKELQSLLESLQYRKAMVEENGIPVGVNAKEYVKSLSKKEKQKKKGVLGQMKHGLDGMVGGVVDNMKGAAGSFSRQFKKGQKSASDENLLRWMPKDGLLSDGDKSQGSVVTPIHSQPVKKEGARSLKENGAVPAMKPVDSRPGNGQATPHYQEAVNSHQPVQTQTSQARSLGANTTGTGKSGTESLSSDSGKQGACSGAHVRRISNQGSMGSPGPEGHWAYEAVTEQALLTQSIIFRDEINTLRKDLTDARNESQILKGTLEEIVRDMRTHEEVHRGQIQNSAERVECLNVTVDECRHSMQREFANLREEFRNLEEKLDYRLTTKTRDLKDSVNNVGNAMTLLEKRLDQTPQRGMDGNRDVRIIYNHLFNLGISLVALIMVVLSGAFQLLIRIVGVGATLMEHRTKTMALILPLILLFALLTYWTVFTDHLRLVANSTSTPVWVADLIRWIA